jgi:hypothetical protein
MPFDLTVYAESAQGTLDTNFNGDVMVSLAQFTTVPGLTQTATLGGTTTVEAVNGIATFENLTINEAATAGPSDPTTGDVLTITGDKVTTNTGNFSVGFTPNQIREAYGVNDLASSGGLDGSGQTIAIVIIDDDPNLLDSTDPLFKYSDLAQFDAEMGLPDPPSLTIVGAGPNGTVAPRPTAEDPTGGSEREESLDVEWAHAIAPAANIVVVECDGSSDPLTQLADLMQGVVTASDQPGVSVVSMSWGLNEGTNNGTVSQNVENLYDPDFIKSGVTFVAASGDFGTSDASYPAFSPYVVAVGGTSLALNSDGTYNSEIGWSFQPASLFPTNASGGGESRYETEPFYQSAVQSSDFRTIPDVAWLGDPQTSVLTYDAYNAGANTNFLQPVAGTSLATPMWAGLIALVNQDRLKLGHPLLNESGPTETLADLYSLPSEDFNDNLGGNNGTSGLSAILTDPTTYNLETGLGSPNVDLLVPNMAAAITPTQLAITVQPAGSVLAANNFSVTVSALDANGKVDPDFTGDITIALSDNPGGSELNGTLTVAAVAGVATFNGLSLNHFGIGYTLEATTTQFSAATDAPLTPATTNSFNVLDNLALLIEPVVSVNLSSPFTVEVVGEDFYGDVDTSFNEDVTAALDANPSGATLGGTTDVDPVDGVADFTTLSINKLGTDYTLEFSADLLEPVITDPFDVSVLPPTITANSATVGPNGTLDFIGPDAISIADPGGAVEQLTLSVLHGNLSLGTTTYLGVTGNNSPTLVLTGGLSDLNNDLTSLVYTYAPAAGYTGSDTLSLNDTDLTDSLLQGASITLTVNSLAPVIEVSSSKVSLNTNGTLVFTGNNAISIADTAGTGNNNEQMTLTVSEGTLSLGTQTGLVVTGNGTGGAPLILTGELSGLNADLSTLTYVPNAGPTGPDTLILSDVDSTDSLSASPVAVSITFNSEPSLIVPTSVSLKENASFTFSGPAAISATDTAGGGNDDVTLTLNVSEGSLSLGTQTGLSVSGAGTAASPLVLSGSLLNLNTDLVSLTYTPENDYSGLDSLALTIDDTTDQMQGLAAEVAITVNPPVFNVPPPVAVGESSAFSFTGKNAISVTDSAGSGNNNETLTLTVNHGTLSLTTTAGLTSAIGNGAVATPLVLEGTLSALNTDLADPLTYTPTAGYSGPDTLTLTIVDSTDGEQGLSEQISITVNVALNTPNVTNATTTDNTQTTSGLVITPNAADTAFVNNFQITNITGGTLFLSNGTTQVTNNQFITVAQGLAGLTFTPATNSLTAGSFTVQESSNATTDGLGGPTATASITVNLALHQPSVTDASTNENTQTTSGLVIAPNAADTAFVNYFQITNITGGTLYLSDGVTQVTNNEFVTVPHGAEGLKFTPTPNSTVSGSFTVEESTSGTTTGLGGPTATATITVNPVSQSLKVTAPIAASVNENALLVFSSANGNAISLTDSAASGTSDSLTLTVTHGTLTLGSTTGLSFSSGSNNSGSMTFKGMLVNLKAAVNELKFTPATGFSGSASLVVTLKDSGSNQSASAPVSIAVDPVVSAQPTASVNENASLIFSATNHNAIILTDGAATGSSDSLTLSVTHGSLTLSSTTGLSFSSGSNGTASMTVKGTLAHLNAALNGLKFTPTTGYSGSASLAVTVADSGDGLSGSATVAITLSVPASQPTVTVKTPVTTAVPGEPVPLVIEVSDTNAAAQAAAFTFAVSFGDGDSTSFSSKAPLVVNHVYTKTGTFTVSVTATDEYGHTSKTATVTIKVVPVAVETDPFNSRLTDLSVGGTSGNDTVKFAKSGKSGIAVTLDGVSEGIFSASGPLIIMGQGGKDTFTEGSGLTNAVDLLANPTADNVETDLDDEALQWAGLSAAVEILNA